MSTILIAGGGLAGSVAALILAENGRSVVIVEKEARIGGKVSRYGCKATDRCNNCGLCLAGGLWDKVSSNSAITVLTDSRVTDISGEKGRFKAVISSGTREQELCGISHIMVATGFKSSPTGCLEFEKSSGIIKGSELEEAILSRDSGGIFDKPVKSVAYMQCFGSRDKKEKAFYCSRVCCGYSTRTARVIRQYYPDAKIVFFYMDMQEVETGAYREQLEKEGFEFIRCRPVAIKNSNGCSVVYEKPGTDGLIEQHFDLVVLSEGIRPEGDVDRLSEIYGLGINRYGFLKCVSPPCETDVYVIGCASGPKGIAEAYSEAVTAAREILGGFK